MRMPVAWLIGGGVAVLSLVFGVDLPTRLCSTREPPQLFSANEFIGQPTTHFASQVLLCTLLTIAWGSGVGVMVCDAEFSPD